MIRDYRHVVTLQKRMETDDGQGGKTVSWQDVARDYADVRSLRGTETARFRRLSADTNTIVMMRWRADVTTDMRLLHDGRILNVMSVVDPDVRRKIIDIYCASSSGG